MLQSRFSFLLAAVVLLCGSPFSFAQSEKETPPPDFVEFEKAPEVIKTATPRYPELARRAGMEGTVMVRVWVDREGKPRKVEIMKSDAEIFNQSAIEAAEQMRFSPALKDGKAVSVWVAMPFKFKLTHKPAAADSAHMQAIPDSLRAAVERLLAVMGMESILSQGIDQMLALQLQQQPDLAPLEPTLRAFLNKYMSWPSLKDDFIRLYSETFTTEEVRDLIIFYRTPTGQKALRKAPELMMKGGQLGSQRVQDNRAELEQMIEEARAEKKN